MALAAGMMVFGSTQAFAQTTRQVDNDRQQCPGAAFTTINAAVAASAPGDTVQVCAGRYPEQVVITKSITVRGLSANNSSRPEIVRPAGGFATNSATPGGSAVAAMVLAQNVANVRILNITVNGENMGTGDNRLIGIYYLNASGVIQGNAVKNINTTPAGLNQSTGIMVANNDMASRFTNVSNNVVVDYEKNGIVANEVGTTVAIAGNVIFGSGLESPSGVSQNGIQLGFGAIGDINNNRVGNNFSRDCRTTASCTAASINIFVFDSLPGAVQNVNDNNVSKANFNIGFFGATFGAGNTNNSFINRNQVNATESLDAIFVDGNNNTIDSNRIFNTDNAAINLATGTGNSVTRNTINDAFVGVNRQDTGNNQSGNVFFNVDRNVNPGPPVIFAPSEGSSQASDGSATSASRPKPSPSR